MVVPLHRLIVDEDDRKLAIPKFQFFHERGQESLQVSAIDRLFPLLVDQGVRANWPLAFNPFFRLLVQTGAIAAAPYFARNMFHKLGRSAVPADDGRHLVR